MVNVTNMIKGAILAFPSSLLVAFIFAYLFRIPVPMAGYIGPFGLISTYGMPVWDVFITVCIAWIFYGAFGGFLILSALGAVTGEIAGRTYAASSRNDRMILAWTFVTSSIPVLILSILDYLIGPW